VAEAATVVAVTAVAVAINIQQKKGIIKMGFLKSLTNFCRGGAKKLEEKMADPTRDAEFAIEDSEKMIADFRSKIADGMGQLNLLRKRVPALETQIQNYQTIAERAVDQGSDADASQALQNKSTKEQELEGLKGQIAGFEKDVQVQRDRLNQVQNKVSQSKSKLAVNKMKHEGAKARLALSKATSDFDNNNPLSQLDALEEAADKMEAQAEAHETLSASETSLEDKYLHAGPNVSNQLAALKANRK